MADLIEGLLQILFVPNDNRPAAGFVGQFLGDTFVAAAVVRIGDEQNVHHRIGALCGLDGVLQFQRAAFVLRVGQDDQGLAPGFVREPVMTRGVNGVVKDGSGYGLRQSVLARRAR